DVLPAETAGRLMETVGRTLETGGSQTIEYQLDLDGERRDFEARMVKSGDDEVLAVVREFTERRRLQDELRARLAEIEREQEFARNLHDGAQQRLVALSLALRLALAKLQNQPKDAESLIRGAADELTLALEELRELARGIHPAILTDRGLAAALEAVAQRAPVPV